MRYRTEVWLSNFLALQQKVILVYLNFVSMQFIFIIHMCAHVPFLSWLTKFMRVEIEKKLLKTWRKGKKLLPSVKEKNCSQVYRKTKDKRGRTCCELRAVFYSPMRKPNLNHQESIAHGCFDTYASFCAKFCCVKVRAFEA